MAITACSIQGSVCTTTGNDAQLKFSYLQYVVALQLKMQSLSQVIFKGLFFFSIQVVPRFLKQIKLNRDQYRALYSVGIGSWPSSDKMVNLGQQLDSRLQSIAIIWY